MQILVVHIIKTLETPKKNMCDTYSTSEISFENSRWKTTRLRDYSAILPVLNEYNRLESNTIIIKLNLTKFKTLFCGNNIYFYIYLYNIRLYFVIIMQKIRLEYDKKTFFLCVAQNSEPTHRIIFISFLGFPLLWYCYSLFIHFFFFISKLNKCLKFWTTSWVGNQGRSVFCMLWFYSYPNWNLFWCYHVASERAWAVHYMDSL